MCFLVVQIRYAVDGELTTHQANLNTRANILTFLLTLCDLSTPSSSLPATVDPSKPTPHTPYLHMLQRDLHRIIDAVAPATVSGLANIQLVMSTLQTFVSKGYLDEASVSEICELLRDREGIVGVSSALQASPPADGHAPPSTANTATSTPAGEAAAPSTSTHNPPSNFRLDRRAIDDRIEQDRERHKRLKETQWQVAALAGAVGRGAMVGDEDPEFEGLWEETSSLCSDDYERMEEEREGRGTCGAEWEDD
jgi:CTD kinase subunit gamma